MPVPAIDARRWATRIERAHHLAAVLPETSDILAFYGRLAEFQSDLPARIPPAPLGPDADPSTPMAAIDLAPVAAAAPAFITWVRCEGAPALAAAAAGVADQPQAFWLGLLKEYLANGDQDLPSVPDTTIFFVEALLQPVAEALAWSGRAAVPRPGHSRCPVCSGRPVAGVLREEAYGARRSLLCGLCLTEWDFLRTLCAGCGEERFDALGVFTAEQLPHVRIEACDTCRTYLKSIDLTKDGLAEPLVDELASVTLDLWAVDRGYRKLRPNLLRL